MNRLSTQIARSATDPLAETAQIGVRRWSAIALVPVLAIAMLGLFAMQPLGALSGSSFGGTDAVLDAGALGLIVKQDAPSGTGDDAFGEGVHEDTNDPPVTTGGVPAKSDLVNFHLATEKAAGQDFMYLSWERAPEQGGTTNMDFEFNQSEVISANGVTPVRTVGDLLVIYEITQGGTQVEVLYRLWEGTQWGGPNSLDGFAEGSYSTHPETGDHNFGEAVINLTASGLFPADECVSFGSAYLKSRSSHSFSAKMKDFIAPAAFSISNCATITIHKDTQPDDSTDFNFGTTGTGLSDFSLDDDADTTLPNARTFADLLPGSYTITEAASGGYDLTSLSCTATPGATGSRATNTGRVEISLVAGSSVDCTFVNTAQPAQLNVIKHVVNDDGGSAVASDFGIWVTGSGVSPADFQGQESPGTLVTLDAGSFNVGEAPQAGYTASYDGCSGLIGRGEVKTCTITNDDVAPGLTVINHVINDNGGTMEAGNFTINVAGASVSPSSFDGNTNGTIVAIAPGGFSVTQGVVDGYAVSYSEDCTGSIALGDTKVCTVVNDDIAPELTVVKTVINDNGGTLESDDFTINVSGEAATPASFAGDAGGTTVALDAGSYSVTEDSVNGYAASYSEDCSGSIAIGESKTCTVVNDDLAPGLTVVKNVINDNGGTMEAGDFDISVDGTGTDPAVFEGSEAGTAVALDAGSYSVTEVESDGYAASYSEDCTGSIGLGEAKVCTITNDDIQPELTVVKTVINDNGGTLESDDFTINVSGQAATPASFAGDASGTTVALNAGSYSVTEDEVDGYAGTFSEDCSGVLSVGDEVTCTVTNIDLQPGLTVIKNVINDNGGAAEAGDFEISVSTAGVDPEPFAGSTGGTELVINAGEYQVTEEPVAGYEGTFSKDCSGSIALGETKACTVTNDDTPAEVAGVTLKNPAEVAGVTLENPKTVEVLGVQLARTGVNIAAGLLVALLLLATGYGLMWVDRRTKGDMS